MSACGYCGIERQSPEKHNADECARLLVAERNVLRGEVAAALDIAADQETLAAAWQKRAQCAESLLRESVKVLRSYDNDFPEKWLVKAQAFLDRLFPADALKCQHTVPNFSLDGSSSSALCEKPMPCEEHPLPEPGQPNTPNASSVHQGSRDTGGTNEQV